MVVSEKNNNFKPCNVNLFLNTGVFLRWQSESLARAWSLPNTISTLFTGPSSHGPQCNRTVYIYAPVTDLRQLWK